MSLSKSIWPTSMKCGPAIDQAFIICTSGRPLLTTLSITLPTLCNNNPEFLYPESDFAAWSPNFCILFQLNLNPDDCFLVTLVNNWPWLVAQSSLRKLSKASKFNLVATSSNNLKHQAQLKGNYHIYCMLFLVIVIVFAAIFVHYQPENTQFIYFIDS